MQLQQTTPQTNMLDLLLAQEPEVPAAIIASSIQNFTPQKPSINSIFTMYKNLQDEIAEKIEQAHKLERELVGTTVTDNFDMKSTRSYEHAAFDSLLRRAQREFAPPAIDLKITKEEVLEATGLSKWDSRDYYRSGNAEVAMDLDKVWNYLVGKYSGDNGKTLVLQKVAERIIYHFGMKHKEGVKRTASHIACAIRVFSEKKSTGEYCAGYHYQRGIEELFNALQAFAEHAELDALSIQLAPIQHGMAHHHYYYALRNKVSFAGLEVVTQKEEWIFRFSHEIAQKLMLFLGEFGQSTDD